MPKPTLSSPFPAIPDTWTCPITGLKVPKVPGTNIAWRAKLLQRARKDTGLQRALYTACSQSILFWVNFAAFTYRKFIIGADGIVRNANGIVETHVPFVTWEIQDRHILALEQAVDRGRELLTDKSRDMGATWDHIVVFHHQWLFKDDRNFLELSRKEDSVDILGTTGERGSDPGTLFGKHDYLNRFLPAWMLPPYDRKRMHLVNLRNQSRIDGESANATAGSSDRRTAILLDEMAKMLEGESIKRSTKDVSACRLVNSTPNGPGTAFSKWRTSGQIEVFSLMYWDHPEKGKGRHVEPNETYSTLGPWLIRSPWFDQQEKERSPKEMAIDVLADHIASGDTYFEGRIIETHRALFAKPFPVISRWSVDFKKTVTTDAIPRIIGSQQRNLVLARRAIKGPLRLWHQLVRTRLDQTKSYTFGFDISRGQGASNSVCSILCNETREKVGEWADANTPPYEFARIACALALWVGGCRRVNMIWEANGPGWDFGRQVVKLYRYPTYYTDLPSGTTKTKAGKKYGWHSSREKKEEALGVLRRAYAHNGFVNHSTEALDEALTYVRYAAGGIGPAVMVEEGAGARLCHGDRVIADMLTLWAIDGKRQKTPKDGARPPKNSMAGRRAEREKIKKRNRRQTSFDFRIQGAP